MEDTKCNKSCKNCTFSCCKKGENLIPITQEELWEMGYIICDDFITEPIQNQE